MKKHDSFWNEGGMDIKPFWPQYWRYLRNIPEPLDPEEICRSDDGGIIFISIITFFLATMLIYKIRRYLIRQV